MNILVFSDTHGDINRALDIFERMDRAAGIDVIVHCGDHIHDAKRMQIFLEQKGISARLVAVPGNCDGCRERKYQILETPAGKILITHGHMENVKYGVDNLLYLAQSEDCVCVCYGHMHVAANELVSGIRLVNPGSLTHPRDGSNGTYAFLVANDERMVATICR